MPGYGYAAVSRASKLVWQSVMAEYLVYRRQVTGVVMLVDARHGYTELDHRLLALIGARVRTGQIKLLVLLTKSDKLNRQEARQALVQAQAELAPWAGEDADIGLTLFSALSQAGVEDAAQAVWDWIHPAATAAAAVEVSP